MIAVPSEFEWSQQSQVWQMEGERCLRLRLDSLGVKTRICKDSELSELLDGKLQFKSMF